MSNGDVSSGPAEALRGPGLICVCYPEPAIADESIEETV